MACIHANSSRFPANMSRFSTMPASCQAKSFGEWPFEVSPPPLMIYPLNFSKTATSALQASAKNERSGLPIHLWVFFSFHDSLPFSTELTRTFSNATHALGRMGRLFNSCHLFCMYILVESAFKVQLKVFCVFCLIKILPIQKILKSNKFHLMISDRLHWEIYLEIASNLAKNTQNLKQIVRIIIVPKFWIKRKRYGLWSLPHALNTRKPRG